MRVTQTEKTVNLEEMVERRKIGLRKATKPARSLAFPFRKSAISDLPGDGYDEIVVGMPYYDYGAISKRWGLSFYGSSTGLNAGGTRSVGSPSNADYAAYNQTVNNANGNGAWPETLMRNIAIT